MLIRLLILLLLSVNLFAEDLIQNWPVGTTESYEFEIKTFYPRETINQSTLTVTREADDILWISQEIHITSQAIKIFTKDKYTGKDLKLKSSDNKIILPNLDEANSMKKDTITVSAVDIGDNRIKILGSREDIATSYIDNDNLITGTGALFFTRGMNFNVGSSVKYNFVNLYQISKDKEFSTKQVQDSVISEENITTPLGSFDCYKVKNIVPGGYGYSYYTKTDDHLPVKTELIHPKTGEPMSTVTLKRVIKK